MSAIVNYFKSPKRVIGFFIKLVFITLVFLVMFYPERFGIIFEAIALVLSPLGVTKESLQEQFSNLSFPALRDILAEVNLSYALKWFVFAALVKIAGIFCGVLRWHFLLRGQGITLPFWYLTKCWFMGRAIGLFLPGTVGLDGYRLVESAAYTGEVIKCTTVIAVEKLIGFVALALLVFVTLPLGARLFTFNPVVLGAVLFVLACFIATAFLLLLNPRIVQVVAAALPTPHFVRDKINKLGVAITAYAGHRGMLLSAVVLGLGVHLGICLMYFGVAMAISGGQSDVFDVLFASPLIIVGSIIAPTVSGVGVREGVMTVLLGGKYGEAAAFLFGHIGLWIGEAVPFLLSVPLLLLATRPDKEQFLKKLDEVRAEGGESDVELHLPPDLVADYRQKLIYAAGAGILGGLIGGAAFGLAEATVHVAGLGTITDTSAYWWAPLVYGLVFSGLGLGVAAVLVFLYLLFNRFASAGITFALSVAGTVGALGLVIGMFRYRRDVLGESAMAMGDFARVGGGALVAAVVCGGLAYVLTRTLRAGVAGRVTVGMAMYALIVLIGVMLASVRMPEDTAPAFDPPQRAEGPNVILIAVDTLRADYLKAFHIDAGTETPNIDALASDSIVFESAFAQSSWTKASFGTIFSGMYPEAHTATGKASALPEEVTTFAEVLESGGYYTRGFSNNPNITSIFNYHQGFVNYTDLKPDLLFGAKASSEKLVLYDILRKVVQVVNARFRGGRIRITDFYQPAERVTDVGLEWIDSDQRPDDAPFLLFLHYMDPHDPFRDPERPGKGYARVQMPNPDPEKYREAFIRSYTYEIEYLDQHIGRLIDGLKERGLYDDTLIVFTSDHGEEFHEHGGWWHGLSLYDEQIAIPLAIKTPGNAAAGMRVFDLARHVDLAPTIADFARLNAADQWQGQPLLTNALESNNAAVPFAHGHLDFEGIKLHSLRTADTKLITANEDNKRDYAPVELYDLQTDPGEQENLANERAPEVALFQKSLDEMAQFIAGGAVEPSSLSLSEMSEEERAQLEALGYLGGDEGAAIPEDDSSDEPEKKDELPETH